MFWNLVVQRSHHPCDNLIALLTLLLSESDVHLRTAFHPPFIASEG